MCVGLPQTEVITHYVYHWRVYIVFTRYYTENRRIVYIDLYLQGTIIQNIYYNETPSVSKHLPKTVDIIPTNPVPAPSSITLLSLTICGLDSRKLDMTIAYIPNTCVV